jgi:two-component system, chemotaxis family, sensor kinase CheA
MSKTTIQSKLVRSTLAVLVPAFLAVTLVVIAIQVLVARSNLATAEISIRNGLQAKGKVLVTNNSQALMGMVADNAYNQVLELVSKTVQADPDIAYGIFIDKDMQPWVNANAENKDGKIQGKVAMDDSVSKWASQQKAMAMKEMTWKGQHIFEFAAPVVVNGEALGVIRYAFSTRQMDEAVHDARSKAIRSGLIIVVILILLGSGAAYASFVGVRSQSRKLVKPLSDLQAAANIIGGGDYNTPVTVESDDEIGDLAQGFEAMRQTVKQYTDHLEELIEEKMRQVRDILENIEQGLFIVNFDGSISPEYSKAANTIMGVDDVSKSSLDEIFHMPATNMEDWGDWFKLVEARHRAMRWDKLSKLAPVVEMELDGPTENEKRFVRVSYQKVYNKQGELSKIMALAQDITEARRIEKIVAEEKERHENEVKTILGLVNNLPEVIHDFLQDLEKRLAELRTNINDINSEAIRARDQYPDGPKLAISEDGISLVFRDLHTIKGNAGTYGFESLTRAAHQAEEILEALKAPIKERTTTTLVLLLAQLDKMDEAFAEIRHTQLRLAGGSEEVLLHIPEHKIEFVQHLSKTLSHDVGKHMNATDALLPLFEACGHLRDVNITKLMDKYKTMTVRLAERLDKKIEFDVQPQTAELEPHFFAPFDEAMTHILRNCVDHGIEKPEVRVAAGKPEAGRIQISLQFTDDASVVTIGDDGNGIDAEVVARKALSSGIVTAEEMAKMTIAEKHMLIFRSGFSTAAAVSDISGRGVGMDAALNSMVKLGGKIEIVSEKGTGTVFRLIAPPQEA